MPTKPRIPKELILEKSLELLIRDGFDNVNIKTIASYIGCSTQPISWHFKNMDGLRVELSKYALDYANNLMAPDEASEHPFSDVGDAFVEIAYNMPNLYKFLYLDGGSKYSLGGLKEIKTDTGNEELAIFLANKFNVSKELMMDYILDVIVYTQGILSFVVSNVITVSIEEVKAKISHASQSLLKEYIKGINNNEI